MTQASAILAPMAAKTTRAVGYDPDTFPRFAVTVDMVVLTIEDGELLVVLVERGEEPYQGAWALPGGFVRPEENLPKAASRELREETGVQAAPYLEQLGAYGDPNRDPRMRVVTVAYLAVLPSLGHIKAGTDARHAQLVPVRTSLRRGLAFDHKRILRDGVEEARVKLETTSLATAFVTKEFTLSDLRAVYETVWGVPLDPGNFRRKVLNTPGFVIPTGRRATPGPEGGKPPDTYTAGTKARLDPPLRRPV